MSRLTDFFRGGPEDAPPLGDPEGIDDAITLEEQKQQLQLDLSQLPDDARQRKLHEEAAREVTIAAEDSIRKLHVIPLGRCPECGKHLRRHLFASICDACGWHTFDTPRQTPVRVHLNDGNPPIEGDWCYEIKSGAVLVLRDDVVIAKVPASSLSWVEYTWSAGEIDQRHKQVVERMEVHCGWCGDSAAPDKDGFHLVHVAFGTTQERYCFCSDECYEAFRKMYPARVDRNCYERNCAECNLCVKRYDDETNSLRLLAKDYLVSKKKA